MLQDSNIKTSWSKLNQLYKIPHPSRNPHMYKSALCNMQLNRYCDVLPFEHTRVRSQENPNTYLNANYVSLNNNTQYIVAQAPVPKSFTNFWQVIWSHDVKVIVMLTKLLEKYRVKAHCYWPDATQPEQFGDLTVTLLDEFHPHNCEYITVKRFKLSRYDQTKLVTHLHYTEWPDHGIPETTHCFCQLLDLTDTYKGKQSRSNGSISTPVLIHCSAGIGRAGTFMTLCVIGEMLRQGHSIKDLDIVSIIGHLRQQRPGMVQTEEQFSFIYRYVHEQFAPVLNSDDCKLVFKSCSSSERAQRQYSTCSVLNQSCKTISFL